MYSHVASTKATVPYRRFYIQQRDKHDVEAVSDTHAGISPMAGCVVLCCVVTQPAGVGFISGLLNSVGTRSRSTMIARCTGGGLLSSRRADMWKERAGIATGRSRRGKVREKDDMAEETRGKGG